MSAVRGRMGRVRRALATGFALQLRAARTETISVVAAQVIEAATLAGQLFVIRRVLVMIGTTPRPAFAAFVPWLAGLGVLYTVRAVGRSFIRERQDVIGELVQREVTLRVAEAASAADLADYDDPDFHDRLRRVRTQTYQHAWSMVWAIMNGSSELLVAISMVVVLLAVAPVTLAVGVAAIVPFVLVNRLRNRLGYQWTVEQTVRDRERTYLEELLVQRTAAPELRSLALGPHLMQRIRTFYDLRIADVRAVSRRRLRAAIAGSVVASLIAVGSLAVLVSAAVSGRLSVAEVGVAVIALQQLTNQLRGAVDVFGEIDAAVPFLEDFSAFEQTTRLPGDADVPAVEQLQTLDLDGLTFTYPGTQRPVLNGVTTTIRGGELIALVGHNGSGKTTLAKVIAGLYQPTGGAIVWNGTNRALLDDAVVRRSVAMVFQDFARFELPLYDNVAFGDIGAYGDCDAVVAASRAAGIAPVVEALGDGYDTRLSRSYEGGAELSGGQWQRLALARAFFRDAPLLVLDEPAAALDPMAERELFDQLRELCRGRTAIVISHRFSTVRSADRILVLDGGRVVEEGSHQQLMAWNGQYARMFNVQAEPYAP